MKTVIILIDTTDPQKSVSELAFEDRTGEPECFNVTHNDRWIGVCKKEEIQRLGKSVK